MEVFSILGISARLAHNVFHGVLNVFDINHDDHVTSVWQGFNILDLIFSPISVMIYFFIIETIYHKAKCKIKSIYYTARHLPAQS